jgi:gamma-butyrobetaine dioxygenase
MADTVPGSLELASAATPVRAAGLVDGAVSVEFADGRAAALNVLALRDGCPCGACRHPVSGQRLFESGHVLRGLRATGASATADGALRVEWSDGHRGVFPAGWFVQPEPRRIVRWDASLGEALPEHEWAAVVDDPEGRAAWLRDVAVLGFALLHGVPVEPGSVEHVAGLFGAVRETNYGRVFDVSVSVGARNLADTALPLSLHTDNPYRDPTPTLQLLHCLVSELEGGDTVLADGFEAAERLRASAPESFERLVREPIRYAYRDEGTELTTELPVISLDANGAVAALHLNNRSKGVPQGDPVRIGAWYEAYLALLALLESPELQIVFRLEPGDLVLMDNLRVLHARTGFASTGSRRLQGCYADRDGLLSTLAVLER